MCQNKIDVGNGQVYTDEATGRGDEAGRPHESGRNRLGHEYKTGTPNTAGQGRGAWHVHGRRGCLGRFIRERTS